MCEYGIQLYSVRDITEKDLPGAIRQMAEMGYKGMEFAGFFGHSAVFFCARGYGRVCARA